MNILEMTDIEIYKAAIKELTTQLGPKYTAKFLQQCRPNESDYSVKRYKLLSDQPDIDTIIARIQHRETERKKEEQVKPERITAWRSGLIELTDIEIYELALQILIDTFDIYGFLRFFQQHFEHLNSEQPTNQLPLRLDGDSGAIPTSETQD